jgi:hypothetical protein
LGIPPVALCKKPVIKKTTERAAPEKRVVECVHVEPGEIHRVRDERCERVLIVVSSCGMPVFEFSNSAIWFSTYSI